MACKSGKVPICFCQFHVSTQHQGPQPTLVRSWARCWLGPSPSESRCRLGPNPTANQPELRAEEACQRELDRDSDAGGRRLRRAPPSPCRHLAGRLRASPEPASSLRWHEAAARPAWHSALARAGPPSCQVALTGATPILLECELRPAKRSPPHILPSILSRQEAAGAGSVASNRRVACIYNVVVLMTSENRIWS